ncbi:UNVERIFIED_CONTAM: F-box protein [Sesamum latifolium]|uniref:F-box protein n=1 Tax=Sesamum latifolium TaxID=2727402 RepID=A0AAW2VXZ5_9LAMI
MHSGVSNSNGELQSGTSAAFMKDRRADALGDLRVLPDEILCNILTTLTPRDVARLSCVSRLDLPQAYNEASRRPLQFDGEPILDIIPLFLDVFRGDSHLLKQFLQSYRLPLLRKESLKESVENSRFSRLSYRAMCYCILHDENVLGVIFSLWTELRTATSWEEVEEKFSRMIVGLGTTFKMWTSLDEQCLRPLANSFNQ